MDFDRILGLFRYDPYSSLVDPIPHNTIHHQASSFINHQNEKEEGEALGENSNTDEVLMIIWGLVTDF